jgi:hypothetical protein
MADEHELEVAEEPELPLPPLLVHGEGFITRRDGTVVPFTLSNEAD